MAHTISDKKKLLNRVRRIRGQVEAIERDLEREADCGETLHAIAACRGAIDALMAEVIEDHIRLHLFEGNHRPSQAQSDAAQELIDALKSYLR